MAKRRTPLRKSKYFFLASLIVISAVAALLIWPFVTSILGGIVLAYIFYPVYKRVLNILKNKTLCAFLVSGLIILVFTIPLLLTANAILKETTTVFYQIRDVNSAIDEIESKYLVKIFENVDVSASVKNMLNKILVNIMQRTENFIISIPDKLIGAFIIVFVIFFLLMEGERWSNAVLGEIPIKEKYKTHTLKRLKEIIQATVYGLIITALIQGGIGALGLRIFGVSSPLLWGIVMFVLAMLPFVGPTLVWLPAAIIKLMGGETFNGLGLLLYGIFLISMVDNILRPKLIGSKSGIHPILVLLGVLGGLQVFGLMGVILGPLALALLVVAFEIYLSEKYETKS